MEETAESSEPPADSSTSRTGIASSPKPKTLPAPITTAPATTKHDDLSTLPASEPPIQTQPSDTTRDKPRLDPPPDPTPRARSSSISSLIVLHEGYLYRKSVSSKDPRKGWIKSFFQLFEDRLVYTDRTKGQGGGASGSEPPTPAHLGGGTPVATPVGGMVSGVTPSSGNTLLTPNSVLGNYGDETPASVFGDVTPAGGGHGTVVAGSQGQQQPKRKALHLKNVQFIRPRSSRFDNVHIEMSYRNQHFKLRGTDPTDVAEWVRTLQTQLQTYQLKAGEVDFPDDTSSVGGIETSSVGGRSVSGSKFGEIGDKDEEGGGKKGGIDVSDPELISDTSSVGSSILSAAINEEFGSFGPRSNSASDQHPAKHLKDLQENLFEQTPGITEDVTICLERFLRSGIELGEIYSMLLEDGEEWVEEQWLRNADVDEMLGKDVKDFGKAGIWINIYSWCLEKNKKTTDPSSKTDDAALARVSNFLLHGMQMAMAAELKERVLRSNDASVLTAPRKNILYRADKMVVLTANMNRSSSTLAATTPSTTSSSVVGSSPEKMSATTSTVPHERGGYNPDPIKPVVYSDVVVAIYSGIVSAFEISSTGEASRLLKMGGGRLEEHVGFALCATFNLVVTQLSRVVERQRSSSKLKAALGRGKSGSGKSFTSQLRKSSFFGGSGSGNKRRETVGDVVMGSPRVDSPGEGNFVVEKKKSWKKSLANFGKKSKAAWMGDDTSLGKVDKTNSNNTDVEQKITSGGKSPTKGEAPLSSGVSTPSLQAVNDAGMLCSLALYLSRRFFRFPTLGKCFLAFAASFRSNCAKAFLLHATDFLRQTTKQRKQLWSNFASSSYEETGVLSAVLEIKVPGGGSSRTTSLTAGTASEHTPEMNIETVSNSSSNLGASEHKSSPPTTTTLADLALDYLDLISPKLAAPPAYQVALEAIVRYGLVRPLLRELLVRAPLQKLQRLLMPTRDPSEQSLAIRVAETIMRDETILMKVFGGLYMASLSGDSGARSPVRVNKPEPATVSRSSLPSINSPTHWHEAFGLPAVADVRVFLEEKDPEELPLLYVDMRRAHGASLVQVVIRLLSWRTEFSQRERWMVAREIKELEKALVIEEGENVEGGGGIGGSSGGKNGGSGVFDRLLAWKLMT